MNPRDSKVDSVSNGSIGLDVFSLEDRSQNILSARSLPPSPKKLYSSSNRSKTIDELRRELQLFKDNGRVMTSASTSCNSAATSQTWGALHSGLALPEKKVAIQGNKVLNEVGPLCRSTKEEVLMPCGRTCGESEYSATMESSVIGGEMMRAGGKQPSEGLHDKFNENATPNHSLYAANEDKLCNSKENPLDISLLPTDNAQVSPLFNSKPLVLPPLAPKVNLPTDLDTFPPIINPKANPAQPSSAPQPSLSQIATASKPVSPSKPLETSWANLFSANRIKSNGLPLEYIHEPTSSPKVQSPCISVTIDEVHEELNRWSNSLIGYVIGVKAPYKMMKQFVERKWKAFGLIETMVLRSGTFLFKFENEDMKIKAMEMGPWSYFDKPLVLKPWSPHCSYEKDEISTIPVWVRFPYLKLHLWSAKTLSKLSSQIGQPLFTDSMTATKQRLAYARVCVEISPTEELPQAIEILDHDGSVYKQLVEYEWVPKMCRMCKSINHGTRNCPKTVRMEWRPRASSTSDSKPQVQDSHQVGSSSEQGHQLSTCEENSSSEQGHQPSTCEEKSNLTVANKFAILSSQQIEVSSPQASHELENLGTVIGEEQESAHVDLGKFSNPMEAESSILRDETLQIDSPLRLEYQKDVDEDPPLLINEEYSPTCGKAVGSQGAASLSNVDYEINEWEQMISKSQRKKRNKILHALAQKGKAQQAKSSAQKPPK